MSLTTVARLKGLLGIPADKTADDANLAEVIERVSKRMAEDCNRIFHYEATITEYHHGDGESEILLVHRPPIVTVASLHDDPDRGYGATYLIDAADYVIDESAGIIRLDGLVFSKGLKNIKVVYAGGYKTIPQDLEEACLALCAESFWDAHGELKALVDEQIVERVSTLRKEARRTIARYTLSQVQ